jgi:hypothetical protein
LIEFWRSDDRGGLLWLSTSQWLGILMLLVGLGIHFGRRYRRPRLAMV